MSRQCAHGRTGEVAEGWQDRRSSVCQMQTKEKKGEERRPVESMGQRFSVSARSFFAGFYL